MNEVADEVVMRLYADKSDLSLDAAAEIVRLRQALRWQDDEIKCIKPVCADFVSFRAGVRQAEREHGIGLYS